MTCHNRRELTRRCLTALARQDLFDPRDLYLVDDGSTDGTGDMVRALLPQAGVIVADGSLFWNGGMRLAWDRALAADAPYDFYLWLNDDVELVEGCLARLVADARQVAPPGDAVVVAAATADPANGTITYGGLKGGDPARPLRLQLMRPRREVQAADTISGNIVLVSAAAARSLGTLRPEFEHIYGDLDYGFRARAAGIPVALASFIGGTCERAPDPPERGLAGLRHLARHARSIHGRDWRRLVALHDPGTLPALRHRIVPWLRVLALQPNRRGVTAKDFGEPA